MASRPWTAALLGVAASAVALAATARSGTVSGASLQRKLGFRPSDQEPTWVSYSDCTGGDELSFETTLVSAVGLSVRMLSTPCATNPFICAGSLIVCT